MAKRSAIEKNHRRQRLVAKNAARRKAIKEVANNKTLAPEERFAASLKLAQMPRNGSKVRVRNRCQLTGRPRGYYRKLKISRIGLRELASSGQVPGMVKSSW
ncbi:MAG: 30S ribosomal protein S14 [Rhodospirillaceae bacterium]|nr:30S ribosomal protein S14 [Rhodospirillaceae bacterium]|tara:strand:+ start:68 stop:373 length:306 start_codon:yes stop_codon:yes gene_type:complete